MSLPEILGFGHSGRGVGVRDHQLILPSVVCSTRVSRRIAAEVGAVTFAHQHGCGIIGIDVAGIDDFFVDLASHPNVGSVLIVSLGCETIQGNELCAKIARFNPSTQYIVIQESGGVEGAVAKGILLARVLASQFKPSRQRIEELVVGIDFSRQIADPRALVDALAKQGITCISADQIHGCAKNFSTLMAQKAQVILSFTSENQPPTGFALIPVINVASASPLHNAIMGEFDLKSDATSEEIAALILKVASGAKTISEANQSGEIVAPRAVRSV
ncbi:MAG: UxaA family hydrolase [Actinomycetota bacterium]